MLFDDDVPRYRTMAILDAVYRFSSIFVDRLMLGDRLLLFDVPSSVEISYFMVILFYCYCSRGRLTHQGTNLGKLVFDSRPSYPWIVSTYLSMLCVLIQGTYVHINI